MDKKTIDNIVWWIPFKKLRNSVRELLLYNIETRNLLIKNQEIQQNIINKLENNINSYMFKKTIFDELQFQEYINSILKQEKYNDKKRLEKFGYKVYSQNDEDGIIQEIFNRIGTTNKFFVEFGVQDGLESNSHYLLFQGWKGVFIEGSEYYYNLIINNFINPIEEKKLTVLNKFITAENINEILSTTEAANIKDIDLLSIDIDGNDYHIFNSINIIKPRVVIIEYNAKFPPPIKWVMPYNPNYIWDKSDNQGASLESINNLAKIKGYQLVGTNISGVNAFFVRKDLCKDKFCDDYSANNLYNFPKYYIISRIGHYSKYFLDNYDL